MQYIIMAEHTPSKYDVRARADGFWEYGVPPTRSRPRIDTHAARYETWQVDGEYGSRVIATEVGGRRTVKKKVQDKADTGDDDDDDHIIGPFVVSVSCGPAPTVPVSHVKVEEEMCKKDEFSPGSGGSEGGGRGELSGRRSSFSPSSVVVRFRSPIVRFPVSRP